MLSSNLYYSLPQYVIRGLKNNLLGLSAITSLQLICQLCSIVTHQNVQQQFPKVFGGLGTFREEYVIKLHDEATPHALYTPRNVPIPMRENVKIKKIDRMESIGVISKVLEPTPWCAGMVVVPKKKSWKCKDLCGFEATEQNCLERNSPNSQSR